MSSKVKSVRRSIWEMTWSRASSTVPTGLTNQRPSLLITVNCDCWSTPPKATSKRPRPPAPQLIAISPSGGVKQPPSSDHVPESVVPDAFNVTFAVSPWTCEVVDIESIVKLDDEPSDGPSRWARVVSAAR